MCVGAVGSLPCRTADVERRRTDVVADGAELRDACGDERGSNRPPISGLMGGCFWQCRGGERRSRLRALDLWRWRRLGRIGRTCGGSGSRLKAMSRRQARRRKAWEMMLTARSWSLALSHIKKGSYLLVSVILLNYDLRQDFVNLVGNWRTTDRRPPCGSQ